jgi:thiamine-phosphate pyrophosphorylase
LIEVQKFVPKGTIIGISCYDDLDFAIKCSFDGASYVAFGAFFATKTKNAKTKPSQQIIMQYKLSGSSAKVCAIGGLTEKNISRMCFYGLDYACVIGRVWSQPSINLSVTKLKQIARKLK